VRDLGTFDRDYCDGVGLLRTEFLYMERTQFPSEEEQYRLYRRVLDAFPDKPVTFRTLDIGGDKPLPYFGTPKEANPALGWRGVRISLEWQELLRVQLRALLRASVLGDLRILIPMVTSLDEVHATHEIFSQVRAQLKDQGYEVADYVPVGVMVEVPSTIWILDQLLEEVDFISVGTNDLVQYLLAVDRDNPLVSRLYEPHHPAVVRALASIASQARAAGKPCTVCGEVAGDQAYAMLLLGLGFTGVSVASHFLAEVRYAVRCGTKARLTELADKALAASGAEEIRELLAQVRLELHEGLEPGEAASEGS
jgi:phosphoenolpyruvate-protein phosphotransferase